MNILFKDEIFIPIEYDNIKKDMYAISNYGRIFNIVRDKEISRTLTTDGYYTVFLQLEDGSRKSFYVHILVAIHFIPKTQEDILLGRNLVNHKNLLPTDNYVSNLEWCTYEENNRHARENGASNIIKPIQKVSNNWGKGTSGEKNGMCSIPDSVVHEICKLLEAGYSVKQVSEMVLNGTENDYYYVYHIKNGSKRKNISSQYNLNF